MSLRARLTVLTALAVGATVVIVATIAWFLVDDRLRDDLDDSMRSTLVTIAELPVPEISLSYFAFPSGGIRYAIAIRQPDGQIVEPEGQEPSLEVGDGDRAAAREAGGVSFGTATFDGQTYRVAAAPGRGGRTVVMARSLNEIEDSTRDLRLALTAVAGIGVVVTAAFALLVSRAALRPVGRLTLAAERVAETQDLSASIEVRRKDELGRLAASINEMLSALDASRRQQRQLVSDAGHELRTPLTSLRTNIEVLARQHDMPEPERQRAFDDITAQLEELTRLMDDLFELARDDRAPVEAATELQLDELLIAAVERVRPRSPDVEIALADIEPTRVLGQRDHLERAVVNVLDNALKWSPEGSRVEVSLVGGAVTVRDHGVGIEAADLPFVFDRFYRASSARSAPGSGLGLAIVRQVVDEHGGTVALAPADGGGTIATITLPTLSAS